ncbi:MAG: ShlB/FhaC/HecB family hemolysin secretion/activation protein [Rhodoferax sp.]
MPSKPRMTTSPQRRLLAGPVLQAIFAVGISAALVLAPTGGAQAADAAATAPGAGFVLNDLRLEGPLDAVPAAWRDLLAPWIGRTIDFAGLRQLQSDIEARFHARGWRLVRVRLPAQPVQDGVIRMVLQAPVLRSVRVEGGPAEPLEAWQRRLPALQVGQVPDLAALDAQLSLLHTHPARRAVVAFEPSGSEGDLAAVIRVREAAPSGWTAFLDNTGNQATGHLRYGLTYRRTDLWGMDHQLHLQAQSAPHDPDDPDQLRLMPSPKVRIVGLSYRVPVPAQAAYWDFTLGRSSVDSGLLAGLFDVRGQGHSASVQFHRFLQRWGAWEPQAVVGLDWRHQDSQMLFGGVNLASPIGVRPWTLGLEVTRRAAPGESTSQSAYLHLVANLPGGRAGGVADFAAARVGADPGYRLLRMGWGLQHAMAGPLAGWSLSGQIDGQLSQDRLVAAEQFSAGGAGSVRGFASRGIGGDRGLRMQWELTGPNWLDAPDAASVLRPALFADAAWTQVLRPTALERRASSIASVGVGLRGQWRNMGWRLDLARAVHQRTGAAPVWGAVHFSVSATF